MTAGTFELALDSFAASLSAYESLLSRSLLPQDKIACSVGDNLRTMVPVSSSGGGLENYCGVHAGNSGGVM